MGKFSTINFISEVAKSFLKLRDRHIFRIKINIRQGALGPIGFICDFTTDMQTWNNTADPVAAEKIYLKDFMVISASTGRN